MYTYSLPWALKSSGSLVVCLSVSLLVRRKTLRKILIKHNLLKTNVSQNKCFNRCCDHKIGDLKLDFDKNRSRNWLQSVLDYALPVYYLSLNTKHKNWFAQIQFKIRAAKLTTGCMHLSSQVKLEAELGWETIETRADILSINIFYKILQGNTRPLVKKCMPRLNVCSKNNRGPNFFFLPFQCKSGKYSNLFFSLMTNKFEQLPKSLRFL